jgi:hypothetical protein
MKKIIMTAFMCLFLASCGGGQIALDPVALKDAPVSIPVIAPIQTSPVQWQVLKSSDMLKLAKSKPNAVVFGLDDTNFKNLSLDLTDATRYIQQEKAVNQMLTDIVTSRQNTQNQPPANTGQK